MVTKTKQAAAGDYRNEYIAAITATLSLVATVATAGWSSPAIPALLSPDSHVKITPDEGSWMISILSIGACVGAIASPAVDRFGRKCMMIISMIPLMLGWILIVYATNVPTIYVARLLHGISYGTIYTVTPIYLGEISSKTIRGSTGILVTVMAKVAFLLQYSIGPYVSFRSLALISLVFPVVFLLTFVWMPESPYFYLAHRNEEAALKSLRWLRRSDFHSEVFRAEFHQMQSLVESNRLDRTSIVDLLKKRHRKSLSIILLLSFGMQLTGISAILGYSQTIFSKLEMDLTAAQLSIILATVQLVTVVIPTFFIDKTGRRPLLLISCLGSVTGLTICSLYFTMDALAFAVDSFSWIPFVATLGFIVSFAIGLATVPFAILGEIFPKNIKAKANAAFSVISSLIVFTVVKLFQVISDSAGTYVSFWIFAVCTSVTTVLIHFWIPETKGKSFEEIQTFMQRVPNKKEQLDSTYL